MKLYSDESTTRMEGVTMRPTEDHHVYLTTLVSSIYPPAKPHLSLTVAPTGGSSTQPWSMLDHSSGLRHRFQWNTIFYLPTEGI